MYNPHSHKTSIPVSTFSPLLLSPNPTVLNTQSHTSTLPRLSEDRKEGERVAEDHRKWKQRMEEECQQLREQRLTSAGRCDELQQRLRATEKAREAAERRLDKEVAVLAQRHALHEKELLFRLEASEEAHWKSVQELRELLTAQHRVGTRWECGCERGTLCQ